MAARRSLRPMVREAAAMLRQAGYFARDLVPKVGASQGPSVVLLHGLYASAGVFRPLKTRLEREVDAACYSFSYIPGPGVLALAKRVSALIEGIESRAPIFLVGHSMGGIVMRYIAASDACDGRVVHSVSLAAPFRGTHKNWLVPGEAGSDLAPDSAILRGLRVSSDENERIPHLSILAQDDELIVPGAYPSYGKHALIRGVGHNGILFDPEALELVVALVRGNSARPRE